jgi:hypothetical protein
MREWLNAYRRSPSEAIWIIDLSYVKDSDTDGLARALQGVVTGRSSAVPSRWAALTRYPLADLLKSPETSLFKFLPPAQTADGSAAGLQSGKIAVTARGRAGDEARIDSSRPAPVLMKRSFYRSWDARVDGEPTAIYRVSPGLQLNFVPAGKHTITWHYGGPNRAGFSRAALASGLVLACAGLLVSNRRKRQASPHEARASAALCMMPSAIWIVFAGAVAMKVFSEAVLRVPVTIYPAAHQAVPLVEHGAVDIYWNYLSGFPPEHQHFTVQIAKDRAFTAPLVSRDTDSATARIRADFVPGSEYFYRVRFGSGGESHPWTRAVPFRIGTDTLGE